MPRIHTITTDTTMNDADMVLGTDGATGANNATKNYTFAAMKAHFLTNPSVTGNLTVAGNTSIGGDLTVTGTSTFNGHIVIGDADTDNVSFGAELTSSIIPNEDGEWDLGSPSKQWRHLHITGISYLDEVDIDGNLDVDGITNLDAVDIDGNVQIDGTLTVGVDDTGVDVKFFGATAGRFLHWDESEDHLLFADNVEARFGNDEDMYVVHSGAVGTIENTTGELIIKSASDIVISNPSAEYMRTDISEGYTLFSRPVKIGSWITDDTTFDSDVTLSSSSPQLHLTNTGTAASNWVSFNTSAGRQGFVGQGHTGQQIGLFADNAELILSSYGVVALTLGTSGTATFVGAITGAGYSGGPISGTTGTFTGNVDITKAGNAVLTVKATELASGARFNLKSADNDASYITFADADDTTTSQIACHGSAAPGANVPLRKALVFKTGGATTALTLDSSQNATFAGTISNAQFTIPNSAGTNGQTLKWPSSGTTLAWGDAGIVGIVEGTNFAGSLIVGHTTTGTLSNAENNTALGISALDAITSGDDNVAVGRLAGSSITSGENNVLIGSSAGWGMTTANDVIAVGKFAADSHSNGGHGDVAIGTSALTMGHASSTTEGRTAIGFNAGTRNQMGYNTFIGWKAGATETGLDSSGKFHNEELHSNIASRCIVIGANAGTSTNLTLDNEIVIGFGAKGKGADTVVIGNNATTAWLPHDDNGVDLGSTTLSFKKLYLGGDIVGSGQTIVSNQATITAADSNKIILLNSAGALTLTLPDSATSGVVGKSFTFISKITPTGGDIHKIVCTDTSNEKIIGTLTSHKINTAGAGTYSATAGSADNYSAIAMDGTTKGGVEGTMIKLTCISVDLWHVSGDLLHTGTMADPYTTS